MYRLIKQEDDVKNLFLNRCHTILVMSSVEAKEQLNNHLDTLAELDDIDDIYFNDDAESCDDESCDDEEDEFGEKGEFNMDNTVEHINDIIQKTKYFNNDELKTYIFETFNDKLLIFDECDRCSEYKTYIAKLRRTIKYLFANKDIWPNWKCKVLFVSATCYEDVKLFPTISLLTGKNYYGFKKCFKIIKYFKLLI